MYNTYYFNYRNNIIILIVKKTILWINREIIYICYLKIF